jgi:DNA-binding transcriptional ArsR family regulator
MVNQFTYRSLKKYSINEILIVILRLIFMGATKTQEYSEAENTTANYAKALGHPARIAILNFIIQEQTCICGDIVEKLPLSQSTVSQHLKELKRAGLIKGDIDGVKVCYCIDGEVWEKAKTYMADFFKPYVNNNKCC